MDGRGSDILVAKVQMPEKGQFLVRVEDGLAASGAVTETTRGDFIVTLDYGEDVGTVLGVEAYDPAKHGSRIPGFRLVRPVSALDEKRIAENIRLAEMMVAQLLLKTPTEGDVQITAARLSAGQKRLFVKCVCANPGVDFAEAKSFLKNQYGVEVNMRALGLRDEVAEIGGLGPCGRVCCCCSWQKSFPHHIAQMYRSSATPSMNGTCGRFKCCLAFERR